MNISEANDLNKVLRYVLGWSEDPEVARDAAVRLTERANRTLGAGLRPQDVEDAWDHLELPGWLDDEPIPWRPVSDVPDPNGLLSDPAGPRDCRRRLTPHDHTHVSAGPADAEKGPQP